MLSQLFLLSQRHLILYLVVSYLFCRSLLIFSLISTYINYLILLLSCSINLCLRRLLYFLCRWHLYKLFKLLIVNLQKQECFIIMLVVLKVILHLLLLTMAPLKLVKLAHFVLRTHLNHWLLFHKHKYSNITLSSFLYTLLFWRHL